ncbi:MAG: RNA polymerase factor sigma-54 [Pirellulaceae bacterium]|nr:RNA polymerase factor sigma-54 [Pirellulaceae bacterium]
MKITFGQHLQQKQTQTLAPRMIQSMEILQMPLVELQERIEQELSENPMLELREQDPNLPDESPSPEKNEGPDVEQKELVVDENGKNEDDFERLLNLDNEFPDHFDGKPSTSANRVQDEINRQHDMIANIADSKVTLQDHLRMQLGELDIPEDLERMCERIISALNAEDGGYLKTALPDLLPVNAGEDQLGVAEQALKIVQSLDPPGVAARDLRECLLLQLTEDLPYVDELKTLINNHLNDLRDNRIPQIQKATGYTFEQIQVAWDQLKKLNPKPASQFAERVVQVVTPDLKAELDDEGNYIVKMDEGPGRRLFISKYYRNRLASGQATKEEKEFIKRKVMAAQWLIESIEQRRGTLSRVAQEILNHQKDFLDQGPRHIKPLKMQQIADKVGVHVTTVSRAVDDKWIDTPRGIFPLRKFFVGGTQTQDGQDVAWDEIRIKLQEIIDAEDKSKPFSDDELVNRLKAVGFPVARRTVTKYRKKMGIPSSRQRRDWSAKK